VSCFPRWKKTQKEHLRKAVKQSPLGRAAGKGAAAQGALIRGEQSRCAPSGTHLLAEAQEPDGVGHALKAAGAIKAAGPGIRSRGDAIAAAGWGKVGGGLRNSWDAGTYAMGFPRISVMIVLSPPRYSKHRLRKLYIAKAGKARAGMISRADGGLG